MKTNKTHYYIAFVLTLFLLSGLLYAEDADTIIKKAQAKYDKVRSFEADFTQLNLWTELDSRKTTKGKIYVLEPNRLLLDYSLPQGQFLLCDGDYIYLYSPSNKQVVKFNVTKLDYNLRFKDLIYKYPEESDVSSDGKETVSGTQCHKLTLIPREGKADFVKLEIWIGVIDLLIHQVAYQDDSDNKIIYTFTNIKINPGLGSGRFVFKKPSGAKIIDKSE
jgi:outer membrane lipoprotein carrier protein